MMPLPQYLGNNILSRLLRMKTFMCKSKKALENLLEKMAVNE